VWRLNAPGDFKVIDADVVTFWPTHANKPFDVTGLLSGLAPPEKCKLIPKEEKDPTLVANRLGALVLHDDNSDCANSDIRGDDDPTKIGGFVSVNREGDNYSVKVNINSGTANTAYLFHLKCNGSTLGTVYTNGAGFAATRLPSE
jgi:hypothetical protein